MHGMKIGRIKEHLSSFIIKGNRAAKKVLSAIVDAITAVIWIILWLPAAFSASAAPSYYPECTRKSAVQRVIENVAWVLRYHRANTFYTLYGLDVKGKNSKEYIDEKTFWKKLDAINYSHGLTSQTCLLRDKFLFYKYMHANGFPVPEVFGVIRDGIYYTDTLEEHPISDLKETDFFLKDAEGECASFVKHIKSCQEFEQVYKTLQRGTYVLQRAVCQVDALDVLNPGAINTLRIVTIKRETGIQVLSSLLRIGTSRTGAVDNWAAGGLAVGVQSDGRLKKYALYKPGYGLKTAVHPDSGIAFEHFVFPFFKEACELAISANRFFYNIGAIGWDIAITDNGPVFIEGNDNFEITLMQACDRPLKRELM